MKGKVRNQRSVGGGGLLPFSPSFVYLMVGGVCVFQSAKEKQKASSEVSIPVAEGCAVLCWHGKEIYEDVEGKKRERRRDKKRKGGGG